MKRQIRIFLAGLLVVVPLAVAAYVVWVVGSGLDGLGNQAVRAVWPDAELPPGLGVLVLIVAIYIIGLLTHLWVFQWAFRLLEGLIARVPGVKVIYESVRDLMKLFGGDAEKMGKVVRYHPPGTDIDLLGIMTNENPAGIAESAPDRRVAVYLPYAYMFGGPTIYVSPEHVHEVGLSVEQALKIAATAHVGANAATPLPPADSQQDSTGPKATS